MAPWEKFDPADQPVIVKPCPPCKHPVSRQCKGGHETSEMACFEAHSYECGLRCGRQLSCGNHTCQRGCHVVVNPPDDIMVLLQWCFHFCDFIPVRLERIVWNVSCLVRRIVLVAVLTAVLCHVTKVSVCILYPPHTFVCK